jgi:hypothetical protein
MVQHGLCRGPRHCEVDERGTQCDQSVAEIGDPCTDGATCSLDGLNLLICRDGRLTLKSACTTGCEIHRKRVECHGTDIAP